MGLRKPKLKLHVVLAPKLTPAQAVVAAAHASLGTYLTFVDNPLMREWCSNSFVKIIHQVTAGSDLFLTCRGFGLHRVFTESTLDNAEVAIGFDILPHDRDSRFKMIPLYAPVMSLP